MINRNGRSHGAALRARPLYRAARVKFFGSTTPPAAPAVTLVEVARLYEGNIMLEVEAIAAA